MAAPAHDLHTTQGAISLGGRPSIMGVLNASPESFSDAGGLTSLRDRVELAISFIEAGADLIDVGGESGVTNRPPVSADEEIARVVPLIEHLAGREGIRVSVDTYKPEVAGAAIAAGAMMVNDISGLRDAQLAEVCAQTGAALVITHTRAAPKEKLLDPRLDLGIVQDVERFLSQRISLALERGVSFEQLILDPGPDLGKTPAQTVQVLGGLARLHALGRPLLLAVSRKDFIGAITARPPRSRLAGTLAAIGHGLDQGAHMLRVHDVSDVVDFLRVRSALRGEAEVAATLRLADELRWEQGQDGPGVRPVVD
jgi:dihydropteroate synthase